MALTRRSLTLEEFLALPEEEPALEFAEGIVTQKMAPKGRHSRLQPKLWEWFNRFAEPRRLALAFTELRTTFAGRSPVPDVAVYRWERIPWDSAGEVPDDFFEPPDIAVEIVSPDQSLRELVDKCQWYVDHGVLVALLVDPDSRSIRVFRPGEVPSTLRGADQIELGEALPGLRLRVSEVFAWLRTR